MKRRADGGEYRDGFENKPGNVTLDDVKVARKFVCVCTVRALSMCKLEEYDKTNDCRHVGRLRAGPV